MVRAVARPERFYGENGQKYILPWTGSDSHGSSSVLRIDCPADINVDFGAATLFEGIGGLSVGVRRSYDRYPSNKQ